VTERTDWLPITRVVGPDGGAISAEIAGPLSAFGELRTIQPTPRFQIDATYGLRASDHFTLTALTGSVTESDAVFTLATGIGAGASAELTSRRFVRYRPGEGVVIDVTASFPPGVANCNRYAGGMNATEALVFARRGTEFGILRRIAGKQTIQRLTITAAANGAQNMTITINGSAVVVASGGALATVALTAQRIATVGVFPGWDATSNGATVTFVTQSAGVTAGAFSFASTGAATGTFASIVVGVANDDVTGFVPQSEWNVDRLDGGDDERNPSGVTLADAGDPSETLLRIDRLNVFQVVFPYLGVGSIRWRIMLPSGKLQTIHTLHYPGSAAVPTMVNPTLRGGWRIQSDGSTTNETLTGICSAGFVDGYTLPSRNPQGIPGTLTASVDVTETVVLLIRVARTFPFAATGERLNLREVYPNAYAAATATANRVLSIRMALNPTLTVGTAAINWISAGPDTCIEYAVPSSSVTAAEGDTTYIGGGVDIDHHFDITTAPRLQVGTILAVCASTLGGAATLKHGISWFDV
jgi:hypothetical protein